MLVHGSSQVAALAMAHLATDCAESSLHAGSVPQADCWTGLPLRMLVVQRRALCCTGDALAFAFLRMLCGGQRPMGRDAEILGLPFQRNRLRVFAGTW